MIRPGGCPAGFLSESAFRMKEGPDGIRLGEIHKGELIVDNTPVETHRCGTEHVLVKREDLCSPFPGPQFSKIRGLVPHLKNRDEQVIGILDTFHSKAGWAVAYVCAELGKQAVVFYPRYKGDWQLEISGGIQRGGPDTLRVQQETAKSFGAILVPLQATAGYILEQRAKKQLKEMYPGSYMLPVGLKMLESVEENAKEAVRTVNSGAFDSQVKTLVISVSSGTVAAGVIKGLKQAECLPARVILHLGYSRPVGGAKGLRANLEHKSGVDLTTVNFVDEKYDYRESAPHGPAIPFPCNPYYDAKAWRYLEAADVLPKPVMFWNVGA
jgi:hypothetical protein